MREIFRSKLFLLLLPLVLLVACTTEDKHVHEEGSRYTCPMHPQIVSEEPGTCPICKMDLVPVKASAHGRTNDSLTFLVKPTNELVQASIATVRPQTGKRFSQDSLRGIINYNTNNWNSISSRINGRIERLYVQYNYQPVTRGQKIMDIYSPDLVSAQQEVLFLQKNGDAGLLAASKRKLRLLGMTDPQINAILRSGKVSYRTTIYSPYAGYLAEGALNTGGSSGPPAGGASLLTEQSSSESSGMGAMGDGSMGSSPAAAPGSAAVPAIKGNAALSIREGQYVTAGQKLFDLIDPSKVWVEFFLRPEQLKTVSRGSVLQVSAVDDPTITANTTVKLIQPYYNAGTNFSVARAVLSNPSGTWRVGQLINVKLASEGVPGTWVPRNSVLQLGNRFVVFVKAQEGFKPVYVQVGQRIGNWIDIGSSIPASTELASNAWFLVDSESFVKPDSIKL